MTLNLHTIRIHTTGALGVLLAWSPVLFFFQLSHQAVYWTEAILAVVLATFLAWDIILTRAGWRRRDALSADQERQAYDAMMLARRAEIRDLLLAHPARLAPHEVDEALRRATNPFSVFDPIERVVALSAHAIVSERKTGDRA